jgi:thiol-disulfide isomerase/thioredoxin
MISDLIYMSFNRKRRVLVTLLSLFFLSLVLKSNVKSILHFKLGNADTSYIEMYDLLKGQIIFSEKITGSKDLSFNDSIFQNDNHIVVEAWINSPQGKYNILFPLFRNEITEITVYNQNKVEMKGNQKINRIAKLGTYFEVIKTFRNIDLDSILLYRKKINQVVDEITQNNTLDLMTVGGLLQLHMEQFNLKIHDSLYYFTQTICSLAVHHPNLSKMVSTDMCSKLIYRTPIQGVPEFEGLIDSLGIKIENTHKAVQVFHFWASWCKPCIAEFKELIPYFASKPEYALILVSIDSDSSSWEEAIKYYKLQGFKHHIISQEQAQKLLQINSIPTNYLLLSEQVKIEKIQNFTDLKLFIEK